MTRVPGHCLSLDTPIIDPRTRAWVKIVYLGDKYEEWVSDIGKQGVDNELVTTVQNVA